MSLHPKQIEAVLALDGPSRYRRFVKQIVDHGFVWSLYDRGWAMAETSDGKRSFPVWPAEDYAELCAEGDWAGYKATKFTFEHFVDEVLPELKEEGSQIAIFLCRDKGAVIPDIDDLLQDLEAESEKYEY